MITLLLVSTVYMQQHTKVTSCGYKPKYPSQIDSQHEMPETNHGYLVMRHIPVNLESLTRAVATSLVSPVSTLPCWDAAMVRSGPGNVETEAGGSVPGGRWGV